MQLINMEVDRLGSPGSSPGGRYQLGPFSPGLNAVCGPRGSGKTTLLHWLRQLAAEDHPGDYAASDPAWLQPSPLPHRLPLAGSVEIENGDWRFRVHSDRGGRRQLQGIEPVSHGRHNHFEHTPLSFDQRQAFSPQQRAAFVGLASVSATGDSEAALTELAARLQLETTRSAASNDDQLQLRQRERELSTRLQQLRMPGSSREVLLARRDKLQAELQQAQQFAARENRYVGTAGDTRRLDERLAAIQAELREVEGQIEAQERELAELREELKSLETAQTTIEIDSSYRQQLQQLDDRLNRWRQTLRDLKVHRDRIDHDATNARLDQQIGDQLSVSKQPDPRASLRSLESQIMSARKQLDALVDRYRVFEDRPAEGQREYEIRRDAQGRTRIAYGETCPPLSEPSNLPETLRSMQHDLYEACQQLARHESQAAGDTLRQQAQQLQRCEAELLQSVEKLIEERAQLLRKIADQYHLTGDQLALAFGDWCGCQDHRHLHAWLLEEQQVSTPRVGADPVARQRLLEQIEAVEGRRQASGLRAEECRRQLRDAELGRRAVSYRPLPPLARSLADVQSDLERLQSELGLWDEQERLHASLAEARRQLGRSPLAAASPTRFRETVHGHIASMMAGHERHREYSREQALQRRYDLVDGIVYDQETRGASEVPTEFVRLAMRLAIAELLTAQGDAVPLLLDEPLESLGLEWQQSAIRHLAQVARGGQQIIVLTSDERLAELIRGQRGWVGYLQLQQAAADVLDINRHLTALANDYEADKWYQPSVPREPRRTSQDRPLRNEYYLTERSLIEESPSIDSLAAARCRALGVDRVGDLLDVDPHWLAENVRLEGVSSATISAWQAEARLLCSVRQLRPFDARLLVGIGVHSPQLLAEMHPSQLLDRVERFLATDRGRRILRSGSSYELSRITTWIASAKSGAGRYQRSNFDDGSDVRHESGFHQPHRRRPRFDESAFHSDAETNGRYVSDFNSERDYAIRAEDADDHRSLGHGEERSAHSTNGSRSRRRTRTSSSAERGRSGRSSRRSSRSYPVLNRDVGPETDGRRARPQRNEQELEQPQREWQDRQSRQRAAPPREPLKLAATAADNTAPKRLKFYLELASPVVDAPSIGPRMAARLGKQGIHTVEQLLAANAESLADNLNLRRLSADQIRGWQDQARLVCRIPNLRGHDAQLLVACDLTSPEELAAMDPESVLAEVLVIAESSLGERILRGGRQPDLEEVSDWILWAGHCRTLHAA